MYRWAFNATAHSSPPPDELTAAFTWLQQSSPLLEDLGSATVLRAALDRLALRQDGKPAAASTVARKRATLHSVLEYAVELELFPSNPLKRIRWKAPKATDGVDRRIVVNPDQARALLEAVLRRDPAVAAFFACLYYAGSRPAEARALRAEDCHLPDSGWGQLLLTGSHQTSRAAWTDSATIGEERGLKHRGHLETRLVPVHPELVHALSRHLDRFELGVDGRLFVTRTARRGVPVSPPYVNPVAMGTLYRAWHRGREAALTERQVRSMLARRPYDLRHACLSTWLNAGASPARVAQWAGHSVDVLLRVYAKCVDGDDEIALKRIEDALRPAGGTGGTDIDQHQEARMSEGDEALVREITTSLETDHQYVRSVEEWNDDLVALLRRSGRAAGAVWGTECAPSRATPTVARIVGASSASPSSPPTRRTRRASRRSRLLLEEYFKGFEH